MTSSNKDDDNNNNNNQSNTFDPFYIETHDEIMPNRRGGNKSGSTSSELHWDIDDSVPKSSNNHKNHKNQQQQNDNGDSFRTSTPQHSNLMNNDTNKTTNNKKPYVSPPQSSGTGGHTWDDDDETQFNSVTDLNERKRGTTRHIDAFHSQLYPLQSGTLSTKSDKSSTYFSTGYSSGPSRRVYDIVETGSNLKDNNDDDAESYNGSVSNQSWTGRMRATQATQYHGSSTFDTQYQSQLPNGSHTKSNIYINERKTEISYFSTSQLLSHDIAKSPALTDASKGVEEIKKFAREDPATTAIGVGVCGVLLSALAFGPIGVVLIGATGAAVYGVSQLPEAKREKIKVKASATAEKFKDHSAKAADYVVTNCGGCGTTETPMKNSYDENDARSLGGGPSVTPQLQHVDIIHKYSPQHIVVNGGPIAGNQHEPIQKDPNALLAQANKGQVVRLVPACCRMSRITPVNQIHSLDPSLHSRAWLDVMASAWTSRDEKNEAMEEILLLAKDKGRARMLLEVRKM